MQKVITMCHWRRPEYTAKCMEYLSRCYGVSEYDVICKIDGGGDPLVEKACAALKPFVRNLNIETHKNHLGCNRNTYSALEAGFQASDYVIHIEDDILFAREALMFLEWSRQFESDTSIFTTGVWRHHHGWLPEQKRPWIPGHERWAGTFPGFFVWGWATWRSRWEEMKAGWTKGDDMKASWDTILTHNVRGNRMSFLPYIGRANNIGEVLGTHRGASCVSHWADSPGFVEPKRFERI